MRDGAFLAHGPQDDFRIELTATTAVGRLPPLVAAMNKPYLSLQPSEAVVVQAAAQIFAAYVTSGRAPEGEEESWIRRAVDDAIRIARAVDAAIQSDGETV